MMSRRGAVAPWLRGLATVTAVLSMTGVALAFVHLSSPSSAGARPGAVRVRVLVKKPATAAEEQRGRPITVLFESLSRSSNSLLRLQDQQQETLRSSSSINSLPTSLVLSRLLFLPKRWRRRQTRPKRPSARNAASRDGRPLISLPSKPLFFAKNLRRRHDPPASAPTRTSQSVTHRLLSFARRRPTKLQSSAQPSYIEDDGYSVSLTRRRSPAWWSRLASRARGRGRAKQPGSLILVRHGESMWNANSTFTGWADPDLSARGERENEHAARLLLEAGYKVDVAYTSRLKRAIRSTWIILSELNQVYRPVFKSWRLNERHYGALTGLSKPGLAVELGEDRVQGWRHGLRDRPPAMLANHTYYQGDERKYSDLAYVPSTESLQDTMERTLPLWDSRISKDLLAGNDVMIVAHGNSLRGVVKHVDRVSDDDIVDVSIPNGIPLVYKFEPVCAQKAARKVTGSHKGSSSRGGGGVGRRRRRRRRERASSESSDDDDDDQLLVPIVAPNAIAPLSGAFLEKKGLLRAALAKENELMSRIPGYESDLERMSPATRALAKLDLAKKLMDLVGGGSSSSSHNAGVPSSSSFKGKAGSDDHHLAVPPFVDDDDDVEAYDANDDDDLRRRSSPKASFMTDHRAASDSSGLSLQRRDDDDDDGQSGGGGVEDALYMGFPASGVAPLAAQPDFNEPATPKKLFGSTLAAAVVNKKKRGGADSGAPLAVSDDDDDDGKRVAVDGGVFARASSSPSGAASLSAERVNADASSDRRRASSEATTTRTSQAASGPHHHATGITTTTTTTTSAEGATCEAWTSSSSISFSEQQQQQQQQKLESPVIIIIRHGKTTANQLGLFTGWEDVPLAEQGRQEATYAGRLLRRHGVEFDVVYTSWLSRAIETAWIVLSELDCLWIPLVKTWRLNERHYGGLTGLSKKMIAQRHGEAMFKKWRRGYAQRPPPVSSFSPFFPGNDERYVKYVKDVGINVRESLVRTLADGRVTVARDLPKCESLKDCMTRTIPFYTDVIAPIAESKNVLIASSENAIRGLLMHLCDVPPDRISGVEIPTGLPLVYSPKTKCLRLLDDGHYADPVTPAADPALFLKGRHDFGTATDLLFKPCDPAKSDFCEVDEDGRVSQDPIIRLTDGLPAMEDVPGVAAASSSSSAPPAGAPTRTSTTDATTINSPEAAALSAATAAEADATTGRGALARKTKTLDVSPPDPVAA